MTFEGVSFKTQLTLVHEGGQTWRLVAPLRCSWRGGSVTVPQGFATDLASIPRLLRWVIPGVGDWNRPSVVHDYLYVHPDDWTRREADRLFLAGLEAEGVGRLKRWAMYAAVRVGGGVLWRT